MTPKKYSRDIFYLNMKTIILNKEHIPNEYKQKIIGTFKIL
jgi:hypothetical protein